MLFSVINFLIYLEMQKLSRWIKIIDQKYIENYALEVQRLTISFTATKRSLRALANRFNWPPIIWNNTASRVNDSGIPGLCTLTATSSPEWRWATNWSEKKIILVWVLIQEKWSNIIFKGKNSCTFINLAQGCCCYRLWANVSKNFWNFNTQLGFNRSHCNICCKWGYLVLALIEGSWVQE